ncbi:putative quinol monooxygenase [Stigmatella aurantiaca]|nr:putative quinol monooxygenase [Stigmatella aurantiaca]ADO70087.1 Antibiotic biosynthesis monooxygenase, domain protein [Stigmatella aurantiaca DW4/3-1]
MTDKVCVVVRLQTKSGREESLRHLMRSLKEKTLQEEGLLRYEPVQSQQDPTLFFLMEEWTSETVLNTHLARPHMERAFSELKTILAAPLEITYCRAVA